LGASPATITKIFMVQDWCDWDWVAGAILGIILATSISNVIDWLNTAFGWHLFDAYFINYLPSYLRWQDVVLIVSVSLILSFLATIYPACVLQNSACGGFTL
jgi:lipoprotein-releasing system permease protein